MPRFASCQVASLPARPPPTTTTRGNVTPRPRSGRALVVAGLVAAEHDLALFLRFLLEQVGAAAVRARVGDRLAVLGEFALGVPVAAVEKATPAALALDH